MYFWRTECIIVQRIQLVLQLQLQFVPFIIRTESTLILNKYMDILIPI